MVIKMIDWMVQVTLPSSFILLLILLIRKPIKNTLGAHISYGLWLLPVMVLFGPQIAQLFLAKEQWLLITENIQPQIMHNLPQASFSSHFDWLLMAWLIGFVLIACLKAWRIKQFTHHALLNATPVDSQKWGLNTGRVDLTYSEFVQSPCISGLIFPTIYLPKNFQNNFNKTQQRLIIQHELAHHKKGDLWLLLMAEIYCCVFWFNPLVQFSKRFFIADQELACDRQVLKQASQQTRLDYGQALHQGLKVNSSPMALSFFTIKHERFIMLNKHQNNTTKTIIGFTLLALLTCTASVFSNDITQNESANPEVSFEFNDIPLPIIVQMIADSTEIEETFVNDKLLDGKLVTAKAKHANSYEVLDEILTDQGLKVERENHVWTFSEL